MRIHSSHISTIALGAVLSATLIVGGCKGKDKGNKQVSTAKIEKIAPRTVSKAETLQSVTAMCLQDSASGIFKWDDHNVSAGDHTYMGVSVEGGDDGKSLNVEKLELIGAHMDGDMAAFDKIVFHDVSAAEDDTTFSVKKWELIKPSSSLSNEISRAFCNDEDAFEDYSGDFGLGGMSLSGLNIVDDEVNMSLTSLLFGTTEDKTGVLNLENLSMDIKGEDKAVIHLGSIAIEGINIDKYKSLFATAAKSDENSENEEDVIKALMGSMNPYNPDFKHAKFSDFHVDAAGMKIDLDSLVADVTHKNGKTVMVQKMSPLTIVPPSKEDASKDMAQFVEAMDVMGYDKLEFTMAQKTILDEEADSMVVTDSYIALKDGFKLSFDYDMTGYKAFMEKAAEQGGSSNANPMAALGMIDDLKMSSMRLALKDDSIVDRAFKVAAAQQGGKPESLKLQAKMGLGFLSMMAKDDAQQKLATDLGTALSKFIDDGGTFIVEMNPKTPVNLGSIASATTSGEIDLDALGITITTK
jgi:outer membrane murein-binding lipoprotein Lpp